MPSLHPETPVAESPGTTKQSDPALSFETRIFSTAELLRQPWLRALTQVINEGFGAMAGPVKVAARLRSDTQLAEELNEGDGFTAVAYTAKSDGRFPDDQEIEVIGTASVKNWLDEGGWHRYPYEHAAGSEPWDANGSGQKGPCDGDYEFALVTVRPGEKYRKRGIADHLTGVCEQEILRRLSLKGESRNQPIRMMVKIVKENNAPYWSRKGFTPVAQKTSPKGTWDSLTEFTMWAMVRELSPFGKHGIDITVPSGISART
ncbi:hypothetical protein PHISP_02331 [Aspergillus sp. HF37]|nr:hypothetical protein PHISP_02331 [Aspergillus sp. HF37]